MNKLTKVVNIYPSMPITGVNPPIRSSVKRVTKSVEEIRACLMARAVVEEVLPNGKTVRLNIGNYDKYLSNECSCGGNCGCGNNCGWKVIDVPKYNPEKKEEPVKSPWRIAYDNALAGKDLASMSRKQRRSAEAAARAVADAVVASNVSTEEEVVIGVGSIETTNMVKEAEVAEEETVVVEEIVEVQEEVVTVDVEELTTTVE